MDDTNEQHAVGLDEVQQEEVARLERALTQIGVWRDEYRESLVELVQLRRVMELAMARYMAEPATTGSRGQQVENKAWGTYREAQTSAHRLAESMLLTPRSRARAGVKEPEDDGLADFLGN